MVPVLAETARAYHEAPPFQTTKHGFTRHAGIAQLCGIQRWRSGGSRPDRNKHSGSTPGQGLRFLETGQIRRGRERISRRPETGPDVDSAGALSFGSRAVRDEEIR